jgi:hypothetical protein
MHHAVLAISMNVVVLEDHCHSFTVQDEYHRNILTSPTQRTGSLENSLTQVL